MLLKKNGCIFDTSDRDETCMALGDTYFNRIINRKYGYIVIDEFKFWASEILYRMAKGVYWAEVDAIIDDIEDDPETHGFERVIE